MFYADYYYLNIINIFILKLLHLIIKDFIIMIQKFSVLCLCFFSLFIHSCYTITHPDPCPGLVEQNVDSEEVSLCNLD